MTDERLRELERRWKETSSLDDEVAYLRERVRVGDLSQERLELAAFVGHAASQQCLNQPFHRPEIAEYWRIFDQLPRFGSEAFTRAALEAAHLLSGPNRIGVPPAVRRALEAAEDFLVEPTPRRQREAVQAGEVAENLVYEQSGATEVLTWFATQPSAGIEGWGSGEGVDSSFFGNGPLVGLNERELLKIAALKGLIPWALGYGDSVRDRVEARQAASD